jgi:hypothetical protein
MKKLIISLSVIALTFFSSCSEDDSNNIPEAYFFTNETASFAVNDDGGAFIELEISSTQKSSVDRTFTVAVDLGSSSENLQASMFSLESNQVVIPAGSFVANIKLFGNYEALPEVESVDLVVKIADSEEALSDKSSVKVNMYRFCTPENVSLGFVFDVYASETSWVVKNPSGVTLYSGGPYANNSAPLTVPLELCSGTYAITVNDSYGDGMFDGAVNGSFTLTQNGVTLATGGGNFGNSTTVNFTVN